MKHSATAHNPTAEVFSINLTPRMLPDAPRPELLRRYARGYMAAGLHVLPLHGVSNGSCTCRRGQDCTSPGKHPYSPAAPHGLDSASDDPEDIDQWLASGWEGNLGLRLDGHIVIDLDRGRHGVAELKRLEEEFGPLPATRWQITGGGSHKMFRLPEGVTLGNSTKNLGNPQHVHIRSGQAGYIVTEPSTHINEDAPYYWYDRSQAIVDLPLLWMSVLARQPSAPARQPASDPQYTTGEDGTAYGLAALAAECKALAETPEGSRNETLNRAAFSMGQLVAGGELDEHAAEVALVEAAETSGLEASEYNRTISRAMRDGTESPRSAPDRSADDFAPPDTPDPPPLPEAARTPIKPLGQWLAEAPESPSWIVESLIAEGCITLLSGREKVGKSTFVFALLQAIENGQPFLGRPTNTTTSLYLTEEGQITFQSKLDHFDLDGSKHYVMCSYDRDGRSWEEVVEDALFWCLDHDTKLVVIDTWAKWVGFKPDEENDAAAVIAKMRPLEKLKKAGIAVLLVHHHSKGADASFGGAIRGSTALGAEVDVLADMYRSREDETERLLSITGRLGEEVKTKLIVDLESGSIVADDDYVSIARGQRDRLNAALTSEPQTFEQLQKATRIKRNTLLEMLTGMVKRGTATRDGAGVRGRPHTYRQASSAS